MVKLAKLVFDGAKRFLPKVQEYSAKAYSTVATAVTVEGAGGILSGAYKKSSEIIKAGMSRVGELKSFVAGSSVASVARAMVSKSFLIPAAIVAAVAAVVMFAVGGGKKDRTEAAESRGQNIQALSNEVAALKDQGHLLGSEDTLMGEKKVTNGAHGQSVLARRGGVAAGVDTSNPNMTAANFTAV